MRGRATPQKTEAEKTAKQEVRTHCTRTRVELGHAFICHRTLLTFTIKQARYLKNVARRAAAKVKKQQAR